MTAFLPAGGPYTPLRRRSSFASIRYCVMLADVRAEKPTTFGATYSSAGSAYRYFCTSTDLPVPVGPTSSSGQPALTSASSMQVAAAAAAAAHVSRPGDPRVLGRVKAEVVYRGAAARRHHWRRERHVPVRDVLGQRVPFARRRLVRGQLARGGRAHKAVKVLAVRVGGTADTERPHQAEHKDTLHVQPRAHLERGVLRRIRQVARQR
eukprot:366401-Chlamydomonas_euryale.AAC.11